jgi:hypothetical protein
MAGYRDSKIMASNRPIINFQLPSLQTIEAAWEAEEKPRKRPVLDFKLFEEQEEMLNLLSQQEDLLSVKLVQLKANCTALKSIMAYEIPKRRFGDLETRDQSYKWSLTLVQSIPNPICKGKYFDLQVALKPLCGLSLPVDTRVPVSIALLTANTPGVEIVDNMSGKPIVKGQTRMMLKYDSEFQQHTAKFRVQVTEVSSHFINGWVKLVVLPGGDHGEIEPLVCNNVVIRAKERTCKKFLERQSRGKPQHRVRNFA